MLNLSLKELKLLAKNRGIKGYNSMCKDKLLSMLNTQRPIKENKTIKDISKEKFNADKIFRDIRTLFEPKEDY